MRASGRHRRQAGVSLLEMLLVIALVAAASLLATAAMSGGFGGLQLRSSAKQIAAQLRYARARAIATGTPQQFTIDPAAHRWTAPNGRHGDIPAQLGIEFFGAREVQPRAGEGAIRFFPDGAATGGRVRLTRGTAAWDVNVKWLTGEVAVRRGEAEK